MGAGIDPGARDGSRDKHLQTRAAAPGSKGHSNRNTVTMAKDAKCTYRTKMLRGGKTSEVRLKRSRLDDRMQTPPCTYFSDFVVCARSVLTLLCALLTLFMLRSVASRRYGKPVYNMQYIARGVYTCEQHQALPVSQ